MKIISQGNIPETATSGLLTMGTFDGVHLGHKHVLHQLNNFTGARHHAPRIVLTFSNHPRSILFPKDKPELLSTLDEKLELFEKEGVDYVYLIEFTETFSKLNPADFIKQHIIPLHPEYLLVGREHFFGNNRAGNTELLKQFGLQYGFHTFEIPAKYVSGINISSTSIRELLLMGKVEEAEKLLGYQYSFSGKVIEGLRIGSSLGYPTANLQLQEGKLIPASGVYAAYAFINKIKYPGMLYIGSRPTFRVNGLSIEMNIFGFSDQLYEQVIRIEPVKHIRGDIRFNNAEQLISQIEHDKIITKQILNI